MKPATRKKRIKAKFIFTGAKDVPVLEDNELTEERIKQEIAYAEKEAKYYNSRLSDLKKLLKAKSHKED